MSKANKQQVPKIRFNRFKDTWSMEQLANLMSFSNGINAPKESYGKGRKMISVLDILQPKSITYNDIVNSVEVDQATEDRNRVQKGDVIFVRSSEIVEEVGWSKAYLDSEYALHSGFTICGTAKHSDFDNYFVELSLNYTNRQQIERKSGGSTRQNISQSVLSEIKFSLPIKEEQTQIGNFFQQLDKLIELQTRAVESAETYKKAMLQKMFPQKGEKVPRVRFEGFSGNWELYNLNDLVKINMGQSPDSENYTDNPEDKILVQGNADLDRGKVIPRIYTTQITKVAEKGDIILTVRAPVGAIAITDFDVVLGRGVAAIKGNRFIYYTLELFNLVGSWLRFSSGSTFDSINSNEIKQMPVMAPNNAEQTKIGNFFQKLDQNIESEKKKLEQYQTMKRALLQRMFI